MDDTTPKKKLYKIRTPQRCRAVSKDSSIPDTWMGLDLSSQGIKNISSYLFDLHFLTELYLDNNDLEFIPKKIINLSNLRVLDISRNKIRSLPLEMGKMINLKELNLEENSIYSIPMELGTLYQLEKLMLNGNPLIEPFNSIYKSKGGSGVIAFCRDHNTGYERPADRTWIDLKNENLAEMISIASYNILCAHFVNQQMFGYAPSWVLQWENRKDLLVQEISSYSTDILCLQEIETESYIEFFREQLELRCNYESLFYPKSKSRSMQGQEKMMVDGCAIFWKRHRFTLLDQKCVEFTQIAMNDKRFRENEDIINRNMNKDNIALIVVLEKAGSGQLIVVNGHIHWDPEYKDVKLFQITILLEEIKKMKERYPNAGIMLCGDLNTLRTSSGYELINFGKLHTFSPDFGVFNYHPFSTSGFTHSLCLKDSYKDMDIEITHFTPSFKGIIDYIFYNEKLVLCSVLSSPEEEYFSKIVGLPSVHFPSDHLLIGAKFVFKNSKIKKKENKVK